MEQLNITSKRITLKLGQWSKQFQVTISNRVLSDTIGLPKLKIPFTIPTSLKYEMKFEDNTLHIGPLIGLLVKQKHTAFSQKDFSNYSNRLQIYNKINGIVFLCSEEGINMDEQTIKGYYFTPNAEKWKEGIFPYPDSMFKRVRIQKTLLKDLQETMGDTIFNSVYFNKFKFWEVCSKDSKAKHLVPESKIYKKPEDVETMIKKYNQVYIKPIRGMEGKGISRIERQGNQFLFTNCLGDKLPLQTMDDTMNYLNKQLPTKNNYILQQGLQSLYRDRHLDFRFYFQKNKNQEWICQGSVARLAKKNRIVTNLTHLSKLLPGHQAIQMLFQTDANHAREILNTTIEDCKIVCHVIDSKIGHYGDIVFDVIIDQNKQTWILEINQRIYGLVSLRKLKKYKTIRKIRTTPIEYAKSLTNF